MYFWVLLSFFKLRSTDHFFYLISYPKYPKPIHKDNVDGGNGIPRDLLHFCPSFRISTSQNIKLCHYWDLYPKLQWGYFGPLNGGNFGGIICFTKRSSKVKCALKCPGITIRHYVIFPKYSWLIRDLFKLLIENGPKYPLVSKRFWWVVNTWAFEEEERVYLGWGWQFICYKISLVG